jgi:hypothetical protein
MLLINASRIDMLGFIEPRGVAAEIGTAEAYYAGYLLAGLKPKKLHLIDPWRFQDVADYVQDANNTTDEEGDRRYNAVCAKFEEPVRAGIVEIHRTLSTEIADSFPDEYFDFIHIDGNHTYAACLADLYAFDRKVKPGGFITGHDYQTIPIARRDNHNGVVQAVNNFVIERGYTFLALTFEEAPTYVIAKDAQSRQAADFVAALAKKHLIMAQIVNAEHKIFEQIEAPYSPQRYIFSFD